MPGFITFKRWTLRDGHQESELLGLVQKDIIPHYEKLPGCLRLGLLRIEGTRAYLALQYWKSREAWQAVTASDAYSAWLEAYKPILERWDKIVALDEEWETEDVLDQNDV